MRLCVTIGSVLLVGAMVLPALGQNLLTNGNLDKGYSQEIVPGFFLPKPRDWQNVGTRSITGPYEDEMSLESWAGPAPTPATNDGDAPFPDGVGVGNDGAVFFKPFSGNPATEGLATGHLYQDVAGFAGASYTMTGWAGAEPNALMRDAEFALEFLDIGGGVIGGSVLSLMPTLFVDNGEPFDYKMYTLTAVAPVGTAFVRVRASMIEAMGNPQGGGQAFVVDDFTLVPEPATIGLLSLACGALIARRRRA